MVALVSFFNGHMVQAHFRQDMAREIRTTARKIDAVLRVALDDRFHPHLRKKGQGQDRQTRDDEDGHAMVPVEQLRVGKIWAR